MGFISITGGETCDVLCLFGGRRKKTSGVNRSTWIFEDCFIMCCSKDECGEIIISSCATVFIGISSCCKLSFIYYKNYPFVVRCFLIFLNFEPPGNVKIT